MPASFLYPSFPDAPPPRTDKARQLYHFEHMVDCETHLKWAGTDYHCSDASYRSALHRWCSRSGNYVARTASFRFIDQESGEARDCLAVQLHAASDAERFVKETVAVAAIRLADLTTEGV